MVASPMWREFLAEYIKGLKNLPELIRRISFKRRNLDDELVEASLRGSLRRAFGVWELLLFGVGIVVGSGVYSPTGTEAWRQAGPAVFVSYIIAGLASLMAAAIYGEFVTEYPVSGGGFTYTMLTFGELPAFLTVANLILAYVVGLAAVAKGFALNLTVLTNFRQDFIIQLGGGSWDLDLLGCGLVLASTLVLAMGSKEYAFLVSGATLLKMGVILVIIIASFTQAHASNIKPFTQAPGTTDFGGVDGMFQAVAIGYYNYVGFDALTNTAEEARNPSHLPYALLGTVVLAMLLYVPLALSFVLLAPANTIPQLIPIRVFTLPGVPLTWVQYLVAVVAVFGVLAGLLVGLFSLARLVMVAARDWLLPPFLAAVYPRTQTPLAAQLCVGVVVAILALIVPLSRLAILVSFGSLFAMWAVSNAHLFRRYFPDVKLRYTKYGTVETATSKGPSLLWVPGRGLPLHVRKALVCAHLLLISAVSVGLTMYWNLSGTRTGTLGFLGGWALCTLSFQLLCPLEYQPAGEWALPWWSLPWLPSVAIVLMVFSIGSLDWAGQHWRITAWMAGSLVFYLLFSLPMSYMKRRMLDHVNAEQLNVVELTQGEDGRWEAARGGATPASSALSPIPHSAQSQSRAADLASLGSLAFMVSERSFPHSAHSVRLQGRLSSVDGQVGGRSGAVAGGGAGSSMASTSPRGTISDGGGGGVHLGRDGSGSVPASTPRALRSGSDALHSLSSETIAAAAAAVAAALRPQRPAAHTAPQADRLASQSSTKSTSPHKTSR